LGLGALAVENKVNLGTQVSNKLPVDYGGTYTDTGSLDDLAFIYVDKSVPSFKTNADIKIINGNTFEAPGINSTGDVCATTLIEGGTTLSSKYLTIANAATTYQACDVFLDVLSTNQAVRLDSDITNTLSISNGGTGQTTADDALNALLPNQSGNSGKYLKTNGTSTSWADPGTGTTTIYKQQPQTVTAATSDDELTITTTAGNNYKINYYILIGNDSTGPDASLSANVDIGGNYDTFRSVIKYIPAGDSPAVTYKNINGDDFNYGMNLLDGTGIASFQLDCTVSNIATTSVSLDYAVTGTSFNFINILEGSYVTYNTF
jgi:hypothetical protein